MLNTRLLAAASAALLVSHSTLLAQCGFQAQTDLAAPAAFENFGIALGVSADSLAVGAPTSDPAGSQSGTVYLYRWTGADWIADGNLLGSDTGPGDNFGGAVAMDGDLMVVGASRDNPLGNLSGSAYVFRRDSSGNWIQEAKLVGSAATTGARFGFSVAVSGDRVFVGAPKETAVASQAGAAYVFSNSGGSWTQMARVQASDASANADFGWDVDADGDRFVVGSVGADNLPTLNTGAAYVFEPSGSTWVEQAILSSSTGDNSDFAGWQVGVVGDQIVVGAYGDDTLGVPNSNFGQVLHYSLVAGTWVEQAPVYAPDASEADGFGYDLEFRGTSLLVSTLGSLSPVARPTEVYVYGFDGAGFSFLQDLGRRTAFPGATGGAAIDFEQGRLVSSSAGTDTVTPFSQLILQEQVLFQDFDGASLPPGVQANMSGLWNQTGACDPIGCFSGERMYYGLPFGCDFDTGGTNAGSYLLSGIQVDPSFDQLEIRYQSLFGGETGCSVDIPLVRINNTVVDNACVDAASGCETRTILVELASFSQPLSIRWTFNSVDSFNNDGHGWSIDDIELTAIDNDVLDCNGNGIADLCDISEGTSTDLNDNGVPDECEDVVSNYCSPATTNSSGGPAVIGFAGSTSLASNDFVLTCTSTGINQFGYYIMSQIQGFTPGFAGSQGNLCLAPPFVRFNRPGQGEILFTGPLGEASLSPNNTFLPQGTAWVSGETWNFQLWFRDTNPTLTSNTSDGLQVLFRP